MLSFSFISFIALFYRVKIANELGAGNGKGAKFTTKATFISFKFAARNCVSHE